MKNIDEIRPALEACYPLITLDCFEHIKAEFTCDDSKVNANYAALSDDIRAFYKEEYLNRPFPVIDKYSEIEFRRTVLAYANTIAHIEACADFIKHNADHDVDIELSIEYLLKAKKLYSITTNFDDIPNIAEVPDKKLPDYLEANSSRQLLHVSYRYFLQVPCFAKGMTEAVFNFEADYHNLINTHIGKHLKAFQ